MTVNGGAGRRTGRRGLWIVAGIAAAGAVAAVVGIWHLPDRMYTDQAARAALQGGLLTAAAALTAVAGGLIALDETRQANTEIRRANENTHVRELYTRAVDQLGADNDTIRLGGIYALERIASDSPADQRTVVEVLSAFVRMHSTDPALGQAPPPEEDGTVPPIRPAADIRAAVQVLARLPVRDGVPRSDLTGADLTGPASLAGLTLTNANLTGAVLSGGDLTGAVLGGATLTGARLGGANLTNAELMGATLTGARLGGANLTGAWLSGATLAGATLDGATLTGARLGGANLTGAWLSGVNLTNAWLSGANLTNATLGGANLTGAELGGANLTNAWLGGANLTNARPRSAFNPQGGLSQRQVDSARGNERTRLPAGLVRPVSWGPEVVPSPGS